MGVDPVGVACLGCVVACSIDPFGKSMTTKACCEGGVPDTKASAEGLCGKLVELESPVTGKTLTCYEVGQEGDKAVIAAYDIFGFSVARTKEVCDEIARAGYRVILPDFYRGTDVLKEFGTFPPAGGIEAGGEWVTRVAPFDQTVREVNEVVVKHLQGKGAKSIGVLGFCWGGKIAVLSSTSELIKAGVGIHPSFLSPDDCEKITSPQMFLTAGNDPPIDPVWEAMSHKPFFDKCFRKCFKDMSHGWSLRADMNDPVQGNQANEAIQLAIQHFDASLI